MLKHSYLIESILAFYVLKVMHFSSSGVFNLMCFKDGCNRGEFKEFRFFLDEQKNQRMKKPSCLGNQVRIGIAVHSSKHMQGCIVTGIAWLYIYSGHTHLFTTATFSTFQNSSKIIESYELTQVAVLEQCCNQKHHTNKK